MCNDRRLFRLVECGFDDAHHHVTCQFEGDDRTGNRMWVQACLNAQSNPKIQSVYLEVWTIVNHDPDNPGFDTLLVWERDGTLVTGGLELKDIL